jgi:hypothetical protein
MNRLIFAGIAITLSFGAKFAQAESPGHIDCPTPVLQYTTGDEEQDEYLYSPSVEWVVTDIIPDPRDPGWIVLVYLVAGGDDEIETLELHPEGLVQVQFQQEWILQRDLEEWLCVQSHTHDIAFNF